MRNVAYISDFIDRKNNVSNTKQFINTTYNNIKKKDIAKELTKAYFKLATEFEYRNNN